MADRPHSPAPVELEPVTCWPLILGAVGFVVALVGGVVGCVVALVGGVGGMAVQAWLLSPAHSAGASSPPTSGPPQRDEEAPAR